LNHSHAWLRTRAPFVALICAVAWASNACYTVPKRPGASVETVSTGKLERKNPIDVVVAPIENASSNENAPVDEMRQALQAGLVKRRYSPLAPEYVDKQIVDAAYKPGALHEDAVFRLKIERWDDSLWELHTALIVKAQAHMIDPDDVAGGDLWTGKIDHRYEFGQWKDKFTTDDALRRYACDQIASEILAALPPRNAAPGSPAH
jgi:hypothetical protein